MKVQKNAGRAVAENGEFMLNGPDGVTVSMSLDAAQRPAGELQRAADEAEAQARRETPELPPEKRNRPPEA